jgi:hypothetical protein
MAPDKRASPALGPPSAVEREREKTVLTLDAPRRYVAYLLRGWAERGDDPAAPVVWRFSLEDPHTGRRRGFADLARLVEALAEECGDGPPPTEAAPTGDVSSPDDPQRRQP